MVYLMLARIGTPHVGRDCEQRLLRFLGLKMDFLIASGNYDLRMPEWLLAKGFDFVG